MTRTPRVNSFHAPSSGLQPVGSFRACFSVRVTSEKAVGVQWKHNADVALGVLLFRVSDRLLDAPGTHRYKEAFAMVVHLNLDRNHVASTAPLLGQ